MTDNSTPDLRTGPERAGIDLDPKTPRPVDELRSERYDTAGALDVFESLLLIASYAAPPAGAGQHPLVLTQAAKALIGLRPDRPSRPIMEFALQCCQDVSAGPRDRDELKVAPDQLGLIVSVHGLEEAIQAGDAAEARAQLGRLLLVSDNREFMFDILLQVAAQRPQFAAAAVPLVHYAQRASDFVGPANRADFLLAALEGVLVAAGGPPREPPATVDTPLSPWQAVAGLADADLGTVALVAHAAQIAGDEHVRGAALTQTLGRTLAALIPVSGAAPADAPPAAEMRGLRGGDLLQLALDGQENEAMALGRTLGQTGRRGWLLEVLEAVDAGLLSPRLILWADAFRMLYRTAPREHYPLLGALAGKQLSKALAARE